MNQIIFSENIINNLTSSVMILVYLLIISCGVYVITTKNPILSVLFLILLFSMVACYLIQLTASFIGLSYLLVYVGAVSILFLFILMLINVRISELVTDNNNSIPLSLFIISVFTIIFNMSIISNDFNLSAPSSDLRKEDLTSLVDFVSSFEYTKSGMSHLSIDNDLYYSSAYTWDTFITTVSHINSIGNIIYTSYPILLLIISIILLLSMIGSIIITVRR